MSAAQKAAQANFKKAIAYRKKTGCTLKQAFAHVKGGKVSGLDKVVKKGNKTTVLYTKKAKKKAAPKKKATQGVLFGTKKKKAAPKKAAVRNYGSHKDTKSHNVKISVMSGAKLMSYKQEVKKYIPKINDCVNEIARVEKDIIDLKGFMKTEKGELKKDSQKLLNNFKNYLAELKKHKTELKKLI